MCTTKYYSDLPFETNAEDILRATRTDILSAKEKLSDSEGNCGSSEIDSRLQTILEISRTMNSTLNLDTLLKYVADKLIDFFHAEHGFIILLDNEGNLIFKVAHNLSGGEIESAPNEVSNSIITEVIRTQVPIFIPNALDDTRFQKQNSVMRLGLKSVMCVPLMTKEELIGVIYVDNRVVTKCFSENDMHLLEVFANQAAIAIENARLFHDLEKAYDDLKSTQEQLIRAEKLRALGQMAGGVAHDFNNVLAVILGRIELLMATCDDFDLKSKLAIIETAALDGAQTVRRIQEFTGKGDRDSFYPINVNNLVKDAINITEVRWKGEADANGISININEELYDVPYVDGKESDLRQVLTNIIFNAVDAMPQGGEIKIKTEQVDEFVSISVTDTGIGMSDDVRMRVFDPFFTTKGVKGNGLGMSVAYGIIERHKGRIEVKSMDGEGSTFTIMLPISKLEHDKEEEGKRKNFNGERGKILVIDDEPEIRNLLADMLRFAGHEISVASNGQDGINMFKNGYFDVILSDLAMPDMSGWEVAKVVKDFDPKTVIILITGWGIELSEQKKNGNNCQIDLILPKPFESDQLLAVIEQGIGLRHKNLAAAG